MKRIQSSISETIKQAIALGYQIPKANPIAAVNPIQSTNSIQSDLKKTTSLIGMAYLNYIYQNDLENPHFCESMLLMNSQVPSGAENPYVHLFDPEMASKTMALLEDIQLSFDYSIARTTLPLEKVQASVSNIQAVLKGFLNLNANNRQK